MSKRKKPAGCIWRGDTLYGYKKIKGTPYKISLETGDFETAKRKRAEWVKQLEADLERGDLAKTVPAVIEEWESFWPKFKGTIGAKTLKRYLVSLRQMEPVFGTKENPLLDFHHINRDVIQEIIELRLEQDGVTPRTLKNDLTAVSSVIDYGVYKGSKKGYLDENPVPAIMRTFKVPQAQIIPPSLRDIEIVRERAVKAMVWAMNAAIVTGGREDELVKVREGHISDGLRQLTLTGKRGKTRTIDISVFDGLTVLRSIPTFLGSDVLIWHDQGEAYSTFASQWCRMQWEIFCEFYDKAHGTNDRTRPSRAALFNYENEPDRDGWKDIGFRRFRFHDLRHLHAVMWLKSGRYIGDLQHRLGHTSVKTTEVYTSAKVGLLTADEVRRCTHHDGRQIAEVA